MFGHLFHEILQTIDETLAAWENFGGMFHENTGRFDDNKITTGSPKKSKKTARFCCGFAKSDTVVFGQTTDLCGSSRSGKTAANKI